MIISTVTKMTVAEAERYGVPLAERNHYEKIVTDIGRGRIFTTWARVVWVDRGDGAVELRCAWEPPLRLN